MWPFYHSNKRVNVLAIALALDLLATLPLFAQQPVEEKRQLDPVKRLQLLSALALVIVLGAVAVLFVRAAGRLVQWYARGSESDSASKRPPINVDDWAQKPLTPPLDDAEAERPLE